MGAEPGRAKRESRITCMSMLRKPPFFLPKSGEKPYLEDSACGAIFLIIIIISNNFCILISKKACQLIPNQWNFTSATLNLRRSTCFFTTISKIRKKSLSRFVNNWKHRLGLESALAALCKWATCTRQTFLSKTIANSLSIHITKKCLGKEEWRVIVVDKSADHDKPPFNLFFTTL